MTAGRWRYAKQAPTPGRRCKDCVTEGIATLRPAPHPGPRCATHHRTAVRGRRRAAHETNTRRVYGLEAGDYQRLYEAQGGLCVGCRRATGASKALAVDHDHRCPAGHPPRQGCRLCVRGLLCSTCNRLIGWYRDDAEAFERLAEYIRNPPARQILNM